MRQYGQKNSIGPIVAVHSKARLTPAFLLGLSFNTEAKRVLSTLCLRVKHISRAHQSSATGQPIEVLQIEATSHRPLCKWQRQSRNSVRAKRRWDVLSVFVYAYRACMRG